MKEIELKELFLIDINNRAGKKIDINRFLDETLNYNIKAFIDVNGKGVYQFDMNNPSSYLGYIFHRWISLSEWLLNIHPANGRLMHLAQDVVLPLPPKIEDELRTQLEEIRTLCVYP